MCVMIIIFHQPHIFYYPAFLIGLFMVATKVNIFTHPTIFIHHNPLSTKGNLGVCAYLLDEDFLWSDLSLRVQASHQHHFHHQQRMPSK